LTRPLADGSRSDRSETCDGLSKADADIDGDAILTPRSRGVCRWATHGAPEDNRNNHPHAAGQGWIVHNGQVLNYAKLVRQYGLVQRTECDSEVPGLLMARFRGSILQRARQAALAATRHLAILGIWRNPARLLIVRDGKPLHFGQTRHGFYFASLPVGLPGKVRPVNDLYVGLITCEAEGLRLAGEEIGRAPTA
jgi:glucosamine 6-phosphate synthetase-like amidotransferase/phosphosugar isomerase protein